MNNRLHKVIFNKSTGLMIAVCETAHNNGKSSKDKRFQVALFSLSGSLKTDLTAKNNVNIIAAQNTQSEKARNESVGAHIGVAFDVQGGSAIGVNIGGNYGKGKANGEEIAYRNSHVGSRTGQTNITAGETLNIKGGQVAGKGVDITAKDMNIESLQDTMAYNSKQHNISADMTIGYGFSGSVSGGMSKINADYASVNEQSGIFAGDDGYRINVQNHTDLKGGIVTSTQKAENNGKNRFETGTLTFADLANHAEYKGEAIGLGVSGSVKGDNPNQNSRIYTVNQSGMSSTMGYGKDSDKQYATTHSGINTANITIRDNEKQQQITGKTAEETIKAVKTDITTDNYAENQGSLKNNFDKDKVQNEIDLQVKVTQEFRSNVQHFQAEQNKRLDELKAKKENGEISEAEYKEQSEKIERQKLITNVVAGGLLSPADSLTGVAVSAVSPAVSHEIGQYFKDLATQNENGQLSTSQELAHILTHAALGAATAGANGGNAVTGAISAGGAEAAAPILSKVLYGESNPANLSAEQKDTLTNIVALSVLPVGSNDFSDMFIAQTVALNAVNNNAVEMAYNKKEKKLYVFDKDKYNPNKPFVYVTDPDKYDANAENQMLVFDGVFTGENLNGNNTVFNKPLPNGEYDILERQGKLTDDYYNWYRLDKVDNERYNDADDDSGIGIFRRDKIRLHLGSNSLGCVTVPETIDNKRQYDNLMTMMNNTSTIVVQDKSGGLPYRFFDKEKSGANITKYGTMRVR